MLRKTIAASSVTALLLLTIAAPTPASAADNGFYLGASVGRAGTKLSDSDLNLSFDGHDTGFKVIAGFRPLDFIGFELNYLDLGSPDDSIGGVSAQTDTTGVDGFVVGFLPLPFMDLFAKVGAISWDSKLSIPSLGASAKESGTDLAYGIGAQARFGSLAGRIEYERFELQDTDKVDMISVGLTWTFL